MKTISLLCPTRGRPARFAAMLESALNYASGGVKLEILAAVDDDDPCVAEYDRMSLVFPMLTVLVGKRKSNPALMNELAAIAKGDLMMAAADDIVFRTPHWDRIVVRAFAQHPDGMLVAYTNDGRDRGKCEHFFVSRAWVQAVGCFMWPEFEHFCADEFVERLGQRVGRTRYLRELVTEHLHFKYGKAARDETYASKRRENVSGRDNQRLAELEGVIALAACRVSAAMRDHVAG
jgi:hypothetical protein